MKVSIEVDSQEEFDLKKSDLIKRIAGHRYDIDLEKSMNPPVSTGVKAQDDMIKYFYDEFDIVITAIKKDVEEILK